MQRRREANDEREFKDMLVDMDLAAALAVQEDLKAGVVKVETGAYETVFKGKHENNNHDSSANNNNNSNNMRGYYASTTNKIEIVQKVEEVKKEEEEEEEINRTNKFDIDKERGRKKNSFIISL